MRDKTHEDQIIRWANYVKLNSDWKMKLKPFIDAQIINARAKQNKILFLPNGKEKLMKIRKLI